MSGRKTSAWKRPKSKVYDYNYNLGEHYYKPQLAHLESKRAGSPPKAATFAERFAADPVYGSNHGVDYRSTADRAYESAQSQRRTSLQDDILKSFAAEEATTRATTRKPFFESTTSLNDDDGFRLPSRSRMDFGERLLDAAGARQSLFAERSERSGGGAHTAGVLEDPFEDPFFAPRKKLLPPQSADPDFLTEDPFKRRLAANMDDDSEAMMRDFKRESDTAVAGFRSRMQARRQLRDEESSDFEAPSSALESRVDQIRARAKARMAELEDDLPALQLRSNNNASSRARALLRDMQDEDTDLSSSVGSSRTLRVTKRTVRVETE